MNQIKELEREGFLVFEGRWLKKVKIGNQEDLWPVASVRMVRRTSPEIIKVPNLEKATSKITILTNGSLTVVMNDE